MLHEEAARLVKTYPLLIDKAKGALVEWMTNQPTSRSMSLWHEWMSILSSATWQEVMLSTVHAQQLRQASLLGSVPDETRRKILEQFAEHKKGVVLVSAAAATSDPTEDPGYDRWWLANA